jgi:hypothetical protein
MSRQIVATLKISLAVVSRWFSDTENRTVFASDGDHHEESYRISRSVARDRSGLGVGG